MKRNDRCNGRRCFLSNALRWSLLSALSHSTQPFARVLFDPEEDSHLKQRAKYKMTFASPYDSSLWAVSPHMHAEFKRNVQDLSNGEIYVDIKDKGQDGIGPVLMEKVSRGITSAALISVSNLSPAAPELDILNIPFWSASNQQYINLVTSNTWKTRIIDKIAAQRRVSVLFHYVPGPRTATTTKAFGRTIRTPSDTRGIRFRIPSSKVLEVFYGLTGATPVKVAWGKTAELARQKKFDALDPGIIGLFNGPDNLRESIGVVSEIDSVHDGWVAVVSQRWFQSLPAHLRMALHEASVKTFKEHLIRVSEVTRFCKQGMEQIGVQIYSPTEEEKIEWQERCGHRHPAWIPVKRKLVGGEKAFAELLSATEENNGYTYSASVREG